jgi:hypothetical protein
MAVEGSLPNPYSSLVAEANQVSPAKYKEWLGRHIQGCEALAPPEPPKPEPKPEPVEVAEAQPCRGVAAEDVSPKVKQLHKMTKAVLKAQHK